MSVVSAAMAVFSLAAIPTTPTMTPDMPADPPSIESSQISAAPDATVDDIVVSASARATAGDPLAKVNAKSFAAAQTVDDAVIGPAATAYRRVLPAPVRDGARNFFRNLREPMIAINDLLQLRPGRSVRTIARFAVNTTVGGAGLFDVAKRRPFRLARHPNSLADTLGYYGVKPGPYLFLPLVGPTTVHDLFAGGLDRLIMPFSIGGPLKQPAYTMSAGVMTRLERRGRVDVRLRDARERSDPYSARRDAYLSDRQSEIDALRSRGSEAAAAFALLDPAGTVR